jgi:hypothetical protein
LVTPESVAYSLFLIHAFLNESDGWLADRVRSSTGLMRRHSRQLNVLLLITILCCGGDGFGQLDEVDDDAIAAVLKFGALAVCDVLINDFAGDGFF